MEWKHILNLSTNNKTQKIINDDQAFLIQNYKKNNISFVSGKNSTLKDTNNNTYIDFASGIGVCSLGHSNKKITKTIQKQSKKLLHTSNLFYIKPQIKLAKKINKLIKPCMSGAKTFFCNSGAEANEAAIKIARKYGHSSISNEINNSSRYEIITLTNSFHGRTLAALKATAQSTMHPQSFAPYLDGFKYANSLDDVYNKITPKTCAVMIELIKGEGGVSALDIKKTQKLAKFLKKQNILLICDEVQTGVYRTGEFVCSIDYKIKPDIITLAKGLGGGVSIGAVVSNIKDSFVYGEHGSTFGGNFLSTSVGLCVLEELQKLQKSSQIKKTIKLFDKKINALIKKYPNILLNQSGFGLMRGIQTKAELLSNILELALKNKLVLLRSGKDIIRFLPPINISKKEINKGFELLEQTLKSI